MKKFELEQAAWEYYLNLDSHHFEEKQHNNIYTDAFEAGAELENKRLVDKACKWLDDNFMNLIWGKTRSVYAGGNFATVDEMIANFRKAMEE